MNKQRIAILIIASIGVLATFMPWSSLPLLGSMFGINTMIGKISIILFIIPLIITLVGNKANELKSGLLYTTIISSTIAVILGVLQIYILKTLGSRSTNPMEVLMAENLSIGFGLYTAILAGLLIPVFAFLMKDSKTPYQKAVPVKAVKKTLDKEIDVKAEEENILSEKIEDKIDKEDHSRFMPK